MSIAIFQTAGNEINIAFNEVVKTIQIGWLSGLMTTAKIGLILYLFSFVIGIS